MKIVNISYSYRPDLVDWRSVRSRVVRERLEHAFHVAEKEYGVTRLLDPEGNGYVMEWRCCFACAFFFREK